MFLLKCLFLRVPLDIRVVGAKVLQSQLLLALALEVFQEAVRLLHLLDLLHQGQLLLLSFLLLRTVLHGLDLGSQVKELLSESLVLLVLGSLLLKGTDVDCLHGLLKLRLLILL